MNESADLPIYLNQFKKCHVVGNYPVLVDWASKGKLIQQVNEQSLVVVEMFHEVCRYYKLPSMFVNAFEAPYNLGPLCCDRNIEDSTVYVGNQILNVKEETSTYVCFQRPHYESFSCKQWLSFTSQPLFEFLKWGIIKYLIGMNGHRRENVYFQDIVDEKLSTRSRPLTHSCTLPGNKILQDLTILGNVCPEVKRKLRTQYLCGSLNSILSIVDRLKVSELAEIFEKYGVENAEVFVRNKADKFYYQFYKELDFSWLSKDEYAMNPNRHTC